MYAYNYGGLYLAPPFRNNSPNASMDYWSRSLFQRLTALFDFENLPEADGEKQMYSWDMDAFKYGLFMLGYLVVFESQTYGVVPQPGTLTGFSLQYQPSKAVVATPYFQFTRPLKLGREAELIKLAPDYRGVYDIITKYAAELKEIDTSIKAAARNSRLAFALIASDDKTAKTLKAIRERIINGEDAIVDTEALKKSKVDADSLPWFQFDQDVAKNYILNELLEARRTTLVDFYREIGVRMVEDKKERMITSEVEAGNSETFIRSEVWIETLKESCDKVNELFGTNIIPKINRPDMPSNGMRQEDAQEVDYVS